MRRAWLLCLLVPALAGAQDLCDEPLAEFDVSPLGTVTHNRTGLMWSRCPLGVTGLNCEAGSPNVVPWGQALREAANALLGGYNDWRLPNRTELASLAEYRCSNPAQNTAAFPNTPFAPFWTSTPAASVPGAAWAVSFDHGAVFPVAHLHGAYVRFVRTVRRVYAIGDRGPAGGIVFYDKGDDEGGWRYLEAAPEAWNGGPDPWVAWGCAGTVVGTAATAVGTGAASTAALDAAGCSEPARIAAEAVINGYGDWFLPSRDELVAMHDVLAVGTNFLDDHGLAPMSYASTSELDATGAIAIDFAGGGEVHVHKGLATVVVRPVRAF